MSVAEVRAERRDLRKAKWVRGPNKCSLSKDCEAYTGTTGTVHSQWQTVIFDGTEKGAVSREDLMMDADAL
jgi:hypothetical protein